VQNPKEAEKYFISSFYISFFELSLSSRKQIADIEK